MQCTAGRSTTPYSGAAPEREWIEAAGVPATTYQWLVGSTPSVRQHRTDNLH